MPGLYQPRFDGDFFPEEVPLLAAKAKPKPTLMSFTKLESESFSEFKLINFFVDRLNGKYYLV
jgi:hypothetical protein